MNNSQKKILIIDDESVIRQSYSDYLEDQEFIIFTAENGSKGLEIFESEDVDLILVDLRMPGIDGLEVLSQVNKKSPDTPIIIVSGTGIISDAVEALHKGAWDYILKPIQDFSVLSHAVNNALEKAALINDNRKYHKHLEQMVEDRTKDLKRKNEELESFTYTVSHDLKSPLITIKGFIGKLKKDIENENYNKVHSSINYISNAADKMNDLLNDLLELSRIGRVKSPSEKVSMDIVVSDAINNLSSQIEAKKLKIKKNAKLPKVYGEHLRLIEVYQNLIDNAVKFIPADKEAIVEIGVKKIKNKNVFFVRDNGIGIAKDYYNKIFGLFEKLDQNVDGSGIGLAIVKKIIDNHNGKIWVESKGLGHGTTFYFTIPQK